MRHASVTKTSVATISCYSTKHAKVGWILAVPSYSIAKTINRPKLRVSSEYIIGPIVRDFLCLGSRIVADE